jgi:ATP-dependent DNA helicase RecG
MADIKLMNTSSLVQKVWNFCHTLRDDGVGYGDYLEQLTYLLFLKLAHEYAQEPYNRDTHIPKGYDWASLIPKVGEPLEAHYLATLHKLGNESGMLGAIFFKAQNKIQDPAKLSRLVQLIDAQNWISLDADTKGDLYEGLFQKLTVDLKVPFQLQAGQRIDDTPVHEALREALVNTLIHADFSGRVSVLVVKRPDMYGFRNPGLMRVPPELAVLGGHSDCRNRRLQKMFQLVGYGDHAGSGLPKIYHNWAGQHWRRPLLSELNDPEQTLMELRMVSLLPEHAVADLRAHLGAKFANLSPLEHLALVTAVTEGKINHGRLREIATEHPSDITKMLTRLVKEDLLVSDGFGRGMVYFVPWQDRRAVTAFEDVEVSSLTPDLGALTPDLGSLTPNLGSLTPELGGGEQVAGPQVISELAQLTEAELAHLQQLAKPVNDAKRSAPELVQQTVLALCAGRYLGLRVLTELLNRRDRDGKDLRIRILNPLVKQGALLRAFPKTNDPRQGYIANSDL